MSSYTLFGGVVIKPCNLFLLSKTTVEDYPIHEKVLTNRVKTSSLQKHEIESIFALVNELSHMKVTIDDFDGFYVDYTIPQISKQFDLLKITDSKILNIELKSAECSIEKIENQLRKNRKYIDPLGKINYYFSVITESKEVYQLDGDEFLKVDLKKIYTVFELMRGDKKEDNASELFNPMSYLISPLNDPKKFVQGRYSLTDAQENAKQKIISNIELGSNIVNGVTGKAGSGKTLLLYDIAREMSAIKRVIVLNCAILSRGHNELKKLINNVEIEEIKNYKKIIDYDLILIDESQRLKETQLEYILNHCVQNKKTCVFFYDKRQVLSKREIKEGVINKLEARGDLNKICLKGIIRTSDDLSKGIRCIFDLNEKKELTNNIIEIYKTSRNQETRYLIHYLQKKYYTFINFSKSNYSYSEYSSFPEEDYDTHHVIGQEFNNVVVVLGKEFTYNESGQLTASEHPNPDYLYTNLLYEALTRAKYKIAIIIQDNDVLYSKMIKD